MAASESSDAGESSRIRSVQFAMISCWWPRRKSPRRDRADSSPGLIELTSTSCVPAQSRTSVCTVRCACSHTGIHLSWRRRAAARTCTLGDMKEKKLTSPRSRRCSRSGRRRHTQRARQVKASDRDRPARRRQPSDCEGRRRRPRAGLHRRDAGLETRRRAPPRRAHRAHRAQGTQSREWNSPFYGIDGQGWFLNFHCFTKYVKVAFFRGMSLRPVPPGASKHEDVRYVDIHEDDQLDQDLLASWIRQASELPGWNP